MKEKIKIGDEVKLVKKDPDCECLEIGYCSVVAETIRLSGLGPQCILKSGHIVSENCLEKVTEEEKETRGEHGRLEENIGDQKPTECVHSESSIVAPTYKDRMIEEYRELKNKYNRLHKLIVKYDAKTLDFELSCPIELLKDQARLMGMYLNILEVRAEIEGIEL